MLYLMFQLSCLSISHLLSSSPVTTQPRRSLKIKMHSIFLWNEKWGRENARRREAKDSRGALNPQRGFIMQEKEHNNHPK